MNANEVLIRGAIAGKTPLQAVYRRRPRVTVSPIRSEPRARDATRRSTSCPTRSGGRVTAGLLSPLDRRATGGA